MLKDFNIEKQLTVIQTWVSEHILTTSTLYQGIIILASFLLAGFVYPVIRRKLTKMLEGADLPATVRLIATNTIKPPWPCIAPLILYASLVIASSEFVGINTTLGQGITKLLLAWIIIRIVVQFIRNTAMRNFFAVVTWAIAALSIFGLLEQTTETLNSIGFSVGESRITALAVINSLLLIVVLLYFALFTSTFAEKKILGVKSLTRSSQVLISKVVRVMLIVFALLVGITSAGIDLSLFTVFGGAIGLGIGFGLQKGISNLFSGMLLLMDRSIKPGDVIELPEIGTFGWVNQMAARYTEIVTRDNKSFLIPNEDFITQRVINWSHGDSLIRVSVPFGVHYKSDVEKVIEIAIEAAKKPPRVLAFPEPVCWITEFGDSSVNFTLRFQIKDAEAGITNVKGEVLLELWKAFKENGIDIPYPHREVYVHEVKD